MSGNASDLDVEVSSGDDVRGSAEDMTGNRGVATSRLIHDYLKAVSNIHVSLVLVVGERMAFPGDHILLDRARPGAPCSGYHWPVRTRNVAFDKLGRRRAFLFWPRKLATLLEGGLRLTQLKPLRFFDDCEHPASANPGCRIV